MTTVDDQQTVSLPMFVPAPQQAEAIAKVRDWYAGDQPDVFRLFGYAGTGKAERNGSKVYTPDGPVNIEDLKVGDLVFGVDGRAIPVTGVFPQGIRDSYKVTFRDGVSVFCDGEHLWNVQTAKMRQLGQPYKTMTTLEIADTGVKFDSGIYRFSIPLCAEVQHPWRDLPVDPYVLGALIGDGTNLGHTPTLCISRDDWFIADEVTRRLPTWALLTLTRNAHCDYRRITDTRHVHGNAIAAALNDMGLAVKSPQRFIPADYLYSSPSQRWDLLRGLMDTDGTARGNRISFSTKSSRLAVDVMTLVQSLGGTAVNQHTGRDDEYCISVKLLTCPFLLPRKAGEWRPSTKNPPSRRIISIEPAGSAEHTCISVDAPDGLYLTDHYVVTHNTTVAQHIVAELGARRVLYAAYTGKAAYVLRTKGCQDASTIHSLIYSPVDKLRARLRALQRELAELVDQPDADPAQITVLEQQIRTEERKLETPDFVLRDESELGQADLLVLDEVSMVGEKVAADLLSWGTPILCLGDPAQLPPVDGGGYFIDAEPDHLLTDIHRQALNSPVTRMATAVREARPGAYQYGVTGPDGDSGRIERLGSAAELLAVDQVLVGTNRTRWQMIHLLRALAGRFDPLPVAGDRVIVIANSGEANVFNGQQFSVDASRPSDRPDRILLSVTGDDGERRELLCWTAGFVGGVDGERAAKRDGRGQVVAATFGCAITVHKSQGSQWDSVLVVDESSVFSKGAYRDAVHAPGGRTNASIAAHLAGQRWLYTAITRAASRALIVPSVNGLLAGAA